MPHPSRLLFLVQSSGVSSHSPFRFTALIEQSALIYSTCLPEEVNKFAVFSVRDHGDIARSCKHYFWTGADFAIKWFVLVRF